MQTIIEVLRFLNYLDIACNLSDGEYVASDDIRKILTIYFQHIDSEQLICILSIVDKIHIRFLRQDFEDIEELINGLRQRIFEIYTKKIETQQSHTV